MSCTGIIETSEVSGSADGHQGWFSIGRVIVTLDSVNHMEGQYAVSIDFVSESPQTGDVTKKASIELSPESAKRLSDVIQSALSRGVKQGILEAALGPKQNSL